MMSLNVGLRSQYMYHIQLVHRNLPGEGADMTFFKPKLSMLPMKELAEREYASE
jgi:hypothetical protein